LDPLIGKRISHYFIVERIGGGGMGVVYRARDELLERDVALKVLSPELLGDEEARKRFRREALALAKLNHPNIETVYELETADGLDILVTEYVPGTTLDEKLKAGPLPDADVVGLGLQLMQGLSAAHEQGIVHRDLKPANLRVTPDGRLKLLDFGLAKLVQPAEPSEPSAPAPSQALTKERALVGTLPYMAPEQVRGDPAGPHTDLYGAGAVLFEMATGQRVFGKSKDAELIGAILHETPPAPSEINQHLSAAMERVILKALSKDPESRYRSAAQLAGDLERSRDAHGPASARRPQARRNAFRALWITVVLGALVAAGIFASTQFTSSTVPAAAANVRRSIAVLGFKNLSQRPDAAWLSTAIAELLAAELAVGGKLRVIPARMSPGRPPSSRPRTLRRWPRTPSRGSALLWGRISSSSDRISSSGRGARFASGSIFGCSARLERPSPPSPTAGPKRTSSSSSLPSERGFGKRWG
jgi:serine/threonine protein kinase